jgi:hypothetical protein
VNIHEDQVCLAMRTEPFQRIRYTIDRGQHLECLALQSSQLLLQPADCGFLVLDDDYA